MIHDKYCLHDAKTMKRYLTSLWEKCNYLSDDLRLFKNNMAMNRTRENHLKIARDQIPVMKIEIEKVITDLGKEISEYESKHEELKEKPTLILKLQKSIQENEKTIQFDCKKKCISPGIMKQKNVDPCLTCGTFYKYYLDKDGNKFEDIQRMLK